MVNSSTADFCNGHGLYVGDNYCWCDGPWTENDCSLKWPQSSTYGLYTTYRAIFTPVASIIFILYTWRLVVVYNAKKHRALHAANSGSLSGGRFTAMFDDQMRSLISGTLAGLFGILLAIDPMGAEPLFGNYSRELAVDTLRIGLNVLNPFWLVRFFIVIQASFHAPSRIALKLFDFMMVGWCAITTMNIIFAGLGEWKNAVHIQIQALFAVAVIVIIGLAVYSIRILQQLLPKKGPNQTDDDLVWTDAQRKTLRFIRITRFVQVVIIACLCVVALVSSVAALNPAALVMLKVWLDMIYFLISMSVLLIMGRPPANTTTSAATDIPKGHGGGGGGGSVGDRNNLANMTSPRPPPINGGPTSPGFGNTNSNGPMSPVSMGIHQPKKSGTFAPGGGHTNSSPVAKDAAPMPTSPLPPSASSPGLSASPGRSLSGSSHVVHVWGPTSEPHLTSSHSPTPPAALALQQHNSHRESNAGSGNGAVSPRSVSPRVLPPIAAGGSSSPSSPRKVHPQPQSSLVLSVPTTPPQQQQQQPVSSGDGDGNAFVMVDVDATDGTTTPRTPANATTVPPSSVATSDAPVAHLPPPAQRYSAD